MRKDSVNQSKSKARKQESLSDVSLEACQLLIEGFEAAEARDGTSTLRDAVEKDGTNVYEGLVTMAIRTLFVIMAEERSLMPSLNQVFEDRYSVLCLYKELQASADKDHDAMARQYEAYQRLNNSFAAIYYGIDADDLTMPPRGGYIFDPEAYPFLEGRNKCGLGFVPSIDDLTVYKLLTRLLYANGERVKYSIVDIETLGQLYESSIGYTVVATRGGYRIESTQDRRKSGSHYTPRWMADEVVERTLRPLIDALGDAPSSEALLSLAVCDPAVGAGAFQLSACRTLAHEVVMAWLREDKVGDGIEAMERAVYRARKLVAQRCLFGVDKNPYVVHVARLSLWLCAMAKDEPFTFVDHAIRHGDALAGLTRDQILAFDWAQKPKSQMDLSAPLVDINREPDKARLLGDLVMGSFFGKKSKKDREKERIRRLNLVQQWLGAEQQNDTDKSDPILVELRNLQSSIRQEHAPFHWPIEFPALSGDRLVAFVGNPPFLGGGKISTFFGDSYRDWLLTLHDGSHGNADLSAHFFRRAASIAPRGCIGFIATNTISQGDTRTTGLKHLVTNGWVIYDATPNMPWPGDAAVTVSIVHLAKGVANPQPILRTLEEAS